MSSATALKRCTKTQCAKSVRRDHHSNYKIRNCVSHSVEKNDQLEALKLIKAVIDVCDCLKFLCIRNALMTSTAA